MNSLASHQFPHTSYLCFEGQSKFVTTCIAYSFLGRQSSMRIFKAIRIWFMALSPHLLLTTTPMEALVGATILQLFLGTTALVLGRARLLDRPGSFQLSKQTTIFLRVMALEVVTILSLF